MTGRGICQTRPRSPSGVVSCATANPWVGCSLMTASTVHSGSPMTVDALAADSLPIAVGVSLMGVESSRPPCRPAGRHRPWGSGRLAGRDALPDDQVINARDVPSALDVPVGDQARRGERRPVL